MKRLPPSRIPFLIFSNLEDKLSLGTFGVDDVVMDLLHLLHCILPVNHGIDPPKKKIVEKCQLFLDRLLRHLYNFEIDDNLTSLGF